jgi:hypothetical protein
MSTRFKFGGVSVRHPHNGKRLWEEKEEEEEEEEGDGLFVEQWE